jgi:O-antigen/teichoic acid export membrane protein
LKKVLHRAKNTLQKGLNSPLARTIGIYTFLNFFLRGISFLITPLFTHYISPDEFGTLNIYLNSINFVTPFVAVGITNTVAVDYFKTSREALSRHIATSLLLSLGIVGVFFVLIIGFQNTLETYFHVSLLLLLAIPLLCFFNLVIDLAFILLRNENQVKKVTIATILRTVLELATSVGFIILLLWGWQGRLYSLILATALAFVGGMVYLFKKYELSWQFDVAFVRRESLFWMSSIVGFYFVVSFNIIDKYIIKYFCTPQELGNYSLATQFGFIILTFSSAVTAAYFPTLFKELSEQKPYAFILKKIFLLIGALIIIALGSIVVVYLMMKYYINERYAGAWEYYYMVALNYGTWSIMVLFYGFLNYFKMKRLMFFLGISAFFILTPFQFLSTQFFGIFGLMLSQLLYFIGCFIVILVILNNKFKKLYHNA